MGVTAGVAHERSLLWGSDAFDANGTVTTREEVFASRTVPTLGTTLDYNFLLGRQRRFLLGVGV